jgi:hypothetical protein
MKSEQLEIARLKRKVIKLKAERDKRGAGHFHPHLFRSQFESC